MVRAHLFTPDLRPGDAAGAHTVRLRRLLDDLGHVGELFVEHGGSDGPDRAALGLDRPTRPFRQYGREVAAHGEDVLIYQLAIGSVVADFLLDRPERLVVQSHNLTPVEYFAPWEPHLASAMLWGRDQAQRLAGRASLGLGVSAFNTSHLESLGFVATATAPFLWAPPAPGAEPALEASSGERRGAGEWLFVGRLAPNKCQHDLVKAFAAHHRFWDPSARLRLVGGSSSPHYERALRQLVERLGLTDVVTLTGVVDDAELAAAYDRAGVFVCLSEHEGFCVPLLEAMHHGLPVVAFGAAAVPETLGSGGLLLDDKSPLAVAAAVARVGADADLRRAMVDAGRHRLDELSLARARTRHAEVLAPLLEGRT